MLLNNINSALSRICQEFLIRLIYLSWKHLFNSVRDLKVSSLFSKQPPQNVKSRRLNQYTPYNYYLVSYVILEKPGPYYYRWKRKDIQCSKNPKSDCVFSNLLVIIRLQFRIKCIMKPNHHDHPH